jgi:transketolase
MNDPSPTYLRLGKGGEEKILTDKNINDNKFSEPLKIMNGTDVSIISSGYILKEAIETAEILNNKGISCSVINLHQLKPVSKKIYDLVKKSSLVVSIEEHSIIGGVGDLVNACINENNECPPLIKIGINDKFVNTIGDRDFLLDLNDLTPTKMSNLIFKKIKNL